MKRCKKIYFLIVSIIFISLFTTISSQRTNHFAKETILSIGGNQFNLENAFKNGKFSGDYSLTNVVSPELDIFGHQNDEIYLNVNGSFKNLKSAIEDGSLKCTPAGKSPADYESIIHGEYAKNIWVEYYNMDLQTAINQGKFYAGDGYCNKKNEPEVSEYYVCSPCITPSHSDRSLYWIARYSRTGNSINRETLYPWGNKIDPFLGEFSWLPPKPAEGFKYTDYEMSEMFWHYSKTSKAREKCEGNRNVDWRC